MIGWGPVRHLPCLSTKSWLQFMTLWLPGLTQISSQKTKTACTPKLNMWLCEFWQNLQMSAGLHSHTHATKRKAAGKNISKHLGNTATQKYDYTDTYSYGVHTHIYTHTFRVTLTCCVYLHSYSDGRHTICHITQFHFAYKPPPQHDKTSHQRRRLDRRGQTYSLAYRQAIA